MPKSTEQLRKEWAARFQPLVGRRIVAVRWLTDAEALGYGWNRSPMLLQLDDGTLLIPSSDEEGNDAGVLFVQPPKGSNLPDTAGLI